MPLYQGQGEDGFFIARDVGQARLRLSRALPPGYRLQLTPEEVADDGLMGPFHRWLDDALAKNGGGFYRPYDEDRGGVAVERWHLSFGPLACSCAEDLTVDLLADALRHCELELAADVQERLPAIYERYIRLPHR